MTPHMMTALTKRELASLHTPTKNELLAFVRNQMTIVIGRADLITMLSETEDPKPHARAIMQSAQEFLADLEQLLKPDPNGALGASEKEGANGR